MSKAIFVFFLIYEHLNNLVYLERFEMLCNKKLGASRNKTVDVVVPAITEF